MHAVIAIGGGNGDDLGKAFTAMLSPGNSILDHLEGVGRGLASSGLDGSLLTLPIGP